MRRWGQMVLENDFVAMAKMKPELLRNSESEATSPDLGLMISMISGVQYNGYFGPFEVLLSHLGFLGTPGFLRLEDAFSVEVPPVLSYFRVRRVTYVIERISGMSRPFPNNWVLRCKILLKSQPAANRVCDGLVLLGVCESLP